MLLYKKKSGEITVFLALILIVLLSFIFVLIKSAKLSFVRTRIEGSADIAMVSSFSEYNKILFERYHLLFIDTTYKGVFDGGNDSFKEHFDQYFERNLYGDSNKTYGLEFISSDISGERYATENGYEAIVSQIRHHMIEISGMDDDSGDEEIIDEYIKSCIGIYTDIDLLYEGWYEYSYEEKMELIVDSVSEDMRELYGGYFDFTKHLCSAEITVYVDYDSSKLYECRKGYSLN